MAVGESCCIIRPNRSVSPISLFLRMFLMFDSGSESEEWVERVFLLDLKLEGADVNHILVRKLKEINLLSLLTS